MNTRDFVVFVSGAALTGVVVWSTAEMRAQSIVLDPVTAIHVCVAADATLHMVDLSAECPSGQKSLFLKKAEADVDYKDDTDKKPDSDPQTAAQIAKLEQEVADLEKLADTNGLGSKVTAPFEVTDRAGHRVLYVTVQGTSFYNAAGQEVAAIATSATGGNFVAASGNQSLKVTLGAGGRDGTPDAGLIVTENGVDRFAMRRRSGTYAAAFLNAGGKKVAGIGQSEKGYGAVYVADGAGEIRGVMAMTDEDKPIIQIANKAPLAVLSVGASLGGKLSLFGADGGGPMVEAGSTADGIGVVRTGPNGFKPGMGVLGLPSSYIAGKQ